MSLHWLLQSSILLLELLGPAIGCSAGPISSERRIVDWERTTNSSTTKECFNIRCASNQGGNLRLISLGYYPSRFQYSWSSNSVNSPTVFRMAYLIPDPSLVVVYLCCITWPACKSLTKKYVQRPEYFRWSKCAILCGRKNKRKNPVAAAAAALDDCKKIFPREMKILKVFDEKTLSEST